MNAKQPPPSATCDKFILRFNVEGLRKELKIRASMVIAKCDHIHNINWRLVAYGYYDTHTINHRSK